MANESRGRKAALMLAALGVVYGDIGTSPLYAVRETFSVSHGIALWRERLFATMARNASAVADYLHLPPNRVIELGTQIEF
ncbi:MAG TPA: KUP/HAK/KT family potassium transporter [Burkholderiales bacterium]|nr:KUP/HAK/KT family potassium transporter [Burkholderiales bacterium]